MTMLEAFLDGLSFRRTYGAYLVKPVKDTRKAASAGLRGRIKVDENGAMYVDTGSGIFCSNDKGRTFSKSKVTPHQMALLASVASEIGNPKWFWNDRTRTS